MDVKIYPTKLLRGSIEIPTSKSQTLRALFSAMLAQGVSVIYDVLDSQDTEAMCEAIESFGVKVIRNKQRCVIHSPGFERLKAPKIIDVKSSGITLRFLAAFCSLFKTSCTITGSKGLITQRSMQDLENGLKRLGVKVVSQNGFCPVRIQGPMRKFSTCVMGHDSQPVSALLWLLSLFDHKSKITVSAPKELPWVCLTLQWLRIQNASISHLNFRHFLIQGSSFKQPFIYKVPQDFSSALFIIAAALIKGEEVYIKNLDFKDPQGDKAVIYLLKQAGAAIGFHKTGIIVKRAAYLTLKSVNIEPFIDALPVLTALAVISSEPVTFYGVSGARGKESDRVKAMQSNLETLGVTTSTTFDTMTVYPSKIRGGRVQGWDDHRIVMASSLLGLMSDEAVIIQGAEACQKTYPQYFDHLKQLGAQLEWM